MAKVWFKASSGALVVMLVWHVLVAMAWRNWDQEGGDSLGFWCLLLVLGAHYGWLYGLLVVTAVLSGVSSSGQKGKRKPRSEYLGGGGG